MNIKYQPIVYAFQSEAKRDFKNKIEIRKGENTEEQYIQHKSDGFGNEGTKKHDKLYETTNINNQIPLLSATQKETAAKKNTTIIEILPLFC